MLKVNIIGNSGAARECYWILRDLLESAPGLRDYYEFNGFYSWRGYPSNLKELACYYRGDAENIEDAPDQGLVIGIGDPLLRKEVFETLKDRGAGFINLVHPWTAICPSAEIGKGNVFQRGCTVYANASIGDGNYINGAVNLSHDAVIGDFNFLAPYSIVLGNARVGNLNWLAPHAVIMERAKVGNRNFIGPNSSVFKGCGDRQRLLGTPAINVGSVNE